MRPTFLGLHVRAIDHSGGFAPLPASAASGRLPVCRFAQALRAMLQEFRSLCCSTILRLVRRLGPVTEARLTLRSLCRGGRMCTRVGRGEFALFGVLAAAVWCIAPPPPLCCARDPSAVGATLARLVRPHHQPLAVELAGDLMFQLTSSSLSTYSIPLRFVEDWSVMGPLFCRELEKGSHMRVRRVLDTFIVADPAPGNDQVSFSHPSRSIMMWLLLTVGDRRVHVRLHHPPGSFALTHKKYIMEALEQGIARVVHSVNTYRLLTRLDEEKAASPLLIPSWFGKSEASGGKAVGAGTVHGTKRKGGGALLRPVLSLCAGCCVLCWRLCVVRAFPQVWRPPLLLQSLPVRMGPSLWRVSFPVRFRARFGSGFTTCLGPPACVVSWPTRLCTTLRLTTGATLLCTLIRCVSALGLGLFAQLVAAATVLLLLLPSQLCAGVVTCAGTKLPRRVLLPNAGGGTPAPLDGRRGLRCAGCLPARRALHPARVCPHGAQRRGSGGCSLAPQCADSGGATHVPWRRAGCVQTGPPDVQPWYRRRRWHRR
jgi:hypothetical protein